MLNKKLLIVDDEESVRKIFEKIGGMLNWEVASAKDGNQALEMIQQEDFQIFVLDMVMPGPSGKELAKEILKKEQSSAIIIISGYEHSIDESELKELGIYKYLQKGNIGIEEIKACLLQAAEYHECQHKQ